MTTEVVRTAKPWRRGIQLSTVDVLIQSESSINRGVGIVVLHRPLSLLVPLHLIAALEEDPSARLAVNGASFERVTIASSASLERDELALVQLKGKRSWGFGSIRIPKRSVQLHAGQRIILGGSSSSRALIRKGSVIEVRERTDGTTIVTDVEVEPGDSGSALLVNRQLVAVCQGMVPNGNGGVAIAMSLSTGSLEHLWKMRRDSFLRRGLPAAIACGLFAVLFALGLLTGGDAMGVRTARRTSTPIGTAESTSVELPRWLRLFESAVNDWESASSSAFALMTDGTYQGERLPMFVWSTEPGNPADVSYDLHERGADGAAAMALTLSANLPMDVRLYATWEAPHCASGFKWLELSRVLRVGTTPQRFNVPYESFDQEVVEFCGSAEDPLWDRLICITFWPEASSGELRFHRFELLRENGGMASR